MADYSDAELIVYLKDEGYNQSDIEKILAKLRKYDSSVFRDSVFDAIETGGFDLRSLVDEALGNESSGESD